MRNYYLLILLLLLTAACSNNNDTEQKSSADTTQPKEVFTKRHVPDTVYVAIADTSHNYAQLRDKLLSITKSSGLTIDTMRHTYFPEKDMVTLPDDDPDKKFAGSYEPRYGIGEYASIEYLQSYDNNAPAKTLAIVAGIHEYEGQAWAALRKIKSRFPNAYVLAYGQ